MLTSYPHMSMSDSKHAVSDCGCANAFGESRSRNSKGGSARSCGRGSPSTECAGLPDAGCACTSMIGGDCAEASTAEPNRSSTAALQDCIYIHRMGGCGMQ